MEVRQLRYFASVAREGSFGRAAVRLNVAQPALSRQIKKLEEELGVELFVRHPHGITMTAAARNLAPRAEHILEEIDGFRHALEQPDAVEKRCLRIGVSPGTAELLAYPLSQLIQRRHPQLTCEFVSMLMPARADLLREGQMALSVMNRPRSLNGLRILPLLREPLCLIHRPDDTRLDPVSIDIADLAGIALILGGDRDSGVRSIIEEAFSSVGLRLTVAAVANTAGTCKALVREGVGPTIHVAAMARAELERGELCAVPIRGLYSVRVIALSEEAEMTPDLRLMIDTVRDCFADLVHSGRWLRAEMIGCPAPIEA
ncbi:LysR family transcriptional regulator [Silicimonas algicola]|uniref:LysR family nitrogen assimilation transcriptional regulator n=1 Tax=Silicimonas algicola TaxID=1826607 RepID=A0A316G0U4_9RHOB|nr:LysR family transcriptional regulator [Silicimonas algicola]AZQ68289.1 LysR family transcriptional regulator [Silicimonas algicola]PWK54574.1 LysR family nitrogen assimilation transcriptional regulator [Silicimonas algicola]